MIRQKVKKTAATEQNKKKKKKKKNGPIKKFETARSVWKRHRQ